MYNPFIKHPRTYGETYFEHFRYALKFGLTLILAGMACIIHSVFPWLFEYTGSNTVFNLTKKLSKKLNSVGKTDSIDSIKNNLY